MRYRLTRHAPEGAATVHIGAGAAVRVDGDRALLAATNLIAPVVDDAYDWGRIAATAALSEVYAAGGRPVVAANLLCWPPETLPAELAGEVLRGGQDVCAAAGCALSGGRRVDDPEPRYGLAVTGVAHPDRLLRNDTGRAGQPLSITKPVGPGVLTARHRATGEWFAEAVDVMTTLDATASAAAVRAGIRCATAVTDLGLLGHLHELARASGVTAVLDAAAVPILDGAHEAVRAGHVTGRAPDGVDVSAVDAETAALLADPQPAGGLLLAGEIDGAPVIGELVPRDGDRTVIVR